MADMQDPQAEPCKFIGDDFKISVLWNGQVSTPQTAYGLPINRVGNIATGREAKKTHHCGFKDDKGVTHTMTWCPILLDSGPRQGLPCFERATFKAGVCTAHFKQFRRKEDTFSLFTNGSIALPYRAPEPEPEIEAENVDPTLPLYKEKPKHRPTVTRKEKEKEKKAAKTAQIINESIKKGVSRFKLGKP